MKRLQLVLILLIITTLSSCKTQEDIRREKTVENLNEQVVQTQKSTANANSRFTTIEEQMSKLSGQLEESNHNRQQELKETSVLKERINGLEETNKKQTEFMKALNEKIQDQSQYIEQVVKSLASLTEQIEKKSSSSSKESRDSKKKEGSESRTPTIAEAITQYKDKDLDSAKSTFLSILDNKKAKKKEKESAYNYLGMIEFKENNFEEAKVYFSKLFSENPDSVYGANALIHLAKSFIKLKSKDEASSTLDELITRFPKSKEAVEGAKIKSKL